MEEQIMQKHSHIVLSAVVFAVLAGPSARAEDPQALIANAISAAPPAVGKNAAVVTIDSKGQVTTIRKGTNNFYCVPDDPTTPSNDPMCVDANGLAWAQAMTTKQAPPAGKIGFGYMLQGETAASNTDPFAAPPSDGKWSAAGPHVMIFNAHATMEGYPKPGNNPDATQPFVMWQDTPYEHLMIPVQ
jgi:hypothetical protein